MQDTNNANADILKAITPKFIEATNEILGVYEAFPSQFALTYPFSIGLARIYQMFMLDVFPSAQILVQKEKFISFAMLCRPALDIVIQLAWLLSLDESKKDTAIQCFVEFEGKYLNAKGRYQLDWQSLIDENYSLRKAAIAVGIDKEILNLPINKVYKQSIEKEFIVEESGEKLNLTVFDYLSKLIHWNPRLLIELIGVNKNMHLGYTNEYLRMCIIALPTFIACAAIFAEIFCNHLFEKLENKDIQIKKLQEIKANFDKTFAEIINSSLVEEENREPDGLDKS